MGATPMRAAISFRFRVPSSGASDRSVRERTFLTPGGRGLHRIVDIGVDLIELLLEPFDGLPDVGPHALRGRFGGESVLLGRDHVDDLTAADDQGFELLRLCVAKMPWLGANTF